MPDYRYMLDANIVSDLIKNPRGAMVGAMMALGKVEYCCTNSIVACELRYGAAKKQSRIQL